MVPQNPKAKEEQEQDQSKGKIICNRQCKGKNESKGTSYTQIYLCIFIYIHTYISGKALYKLVLEYPAYGKTHQCFGVALTPTFIRQLSHQSSSIVGHHHNLWEEDACNSRHVKHLRDDIANLFNHKCGNHSKCSARYCQHAAALVTCQTTDTQTEEEDISLTSTTPKDQLPLTEQFRKHRNDIMQKTSTQAGALIQQKTTNCLESHNGILAQLTKGKRVMMLQGETWLARIAFTVAQKFCGVHWVVVLYMTRFPGFSSNDFLGLAWLNRLKIQQDLKAVNRSSESAKSSHYAAKDSIGMLTKGSSKSAHGYTGCAYRTALPYSLHELTSLVQKSIQNRALSDAARVTRFVSMGQYTDPQWWILRGYVVTGSKVGAIVRLVSGKHRGKFVTSQCGNGASSSASMAPSILRGIHEEPITLKLASLGMCLGRRTMETSRHWHLCTRQGTSASSLDGVFHSTNKKC